MSAHLTDELPRLLTGEAEPRRRARGRCAPAHLRRLPAGTGVRRRRARLADLGAAVRAGDRGARAGGQLRPAQRRPTSRTSSAATRTAGSVRGVRPGAPRGRRGTSAGEREPRRPRRRRYLRRGRGRRRASPAPAPASTSRPPAAARPRRDAHRRTARVRQGHDRRRPLTSATARSTSRRRRCRSSPTKRYEVWLTDTKRTRMQPIGWIGNDGTAQLTVPTAI